VNEIVHARSLFDALKHTDAEGEFWSARELMPVMDYSRWEDFAAMVERAKASLALVQGAEVAGNHFAIFRSDGGRWGKTKLDDYRLSRFGAYLTAMAGDDTKRAIAEARIYFAVKTREAEVAPAKPALPQTYAAALRELASTVEELEAVKATKAALEAPAAAWDHLASANGDWSVGDAAKILSRDPAIRTGQGRLFKLLGEWGWLYRGGDGAWRVKQTQIETKRLTEIPQTHYHPRTGELVSDPPQVRVRPKGLVEIHRRLGGTKPLAVQEQLELGR
jgi:phage antirepressor YoqD-like protein